MPRKKRVPAPPNIETPKIEDPVVEPIVETPADVEPEAPETPDDVAPTVPEPLPESPVCSRVRQSIKKQLAAQWNDQGGKL